MGADSDPASDVWELGWLLFVVSWSIVFETGVSLLRKQLFAEEDRQTDTWEAFSSYQTSSGMVFSSITDKQIRHFAWHCTRFDVGSRLSKLGAEFFLRTLLLRLDSEQNPTH